MSAGVIWSFGAVLVRGTTTLDVWQYLGWRSIGLIAMLWVLAVLRGQNLPRATLRQAGIGWMAAVGLFFSSLMIIVALKTTSVANAVFLSSTGPVIALVLSGIVFSDRPTAGIVASALAALSGIGIMVLGDAGNGSSIGNIAAVASAAGFAVYSLCLRAQPGKDWSTSLWAHGWMCLLVCIVMAALKGPLFQGGWERAVPAFHGAIIIGVGLLLFNRASRMVSAVNLAIIAQTETVLAPVWGWALLAELPPMPSLVGGAVILIGVIGAGLATVRLATTIPPVVSP
ncbi:DMT family transporter [Mesorhizobium sp. IRAMC:0171]|uniref:DMT family transporter n=2 Tax=Mesorhizobium retamae TaxID=2912854 RepID=A0ABS9QDA8_9HYPH|nr:DMT family transporter [Mesorhizobium sp. IRAMC:0171]